MQPHAKKAPLAPLLSPPIVYPSISILTRLDQTVAAASKTHLPKLAARDSPPPALARALEPVWCERHPGASRVSALLKPKP
jgi:hypothetical protein